MVKAAAVRCSTPIDANNSHNNVNLTSNFTHTVIKPRLNANVDSIYGMKYSTLKTISVRNESVQYESKKHYSSRFVSPKTKRALK